MKQNNKKKTIKTKNVLPMVMIRFSEIAIKSSKTRRWLTNQLINHINYILDSYNFHDFQIIKEYSRIFIKTEEPEKVCRIISVLVPGVASTSIVFHATTNLDQIQKVIQLHFSQDIRRSKTFAVRVKRTGKHSFTSIELAAKLGEYILKNNSDIQLKVDLSNPEYVLNVEVRDDDTYIFDKIVKGLGGLPTGCQGRALVIVEGTTEDVSNIIQLYKRGVSTIIYSLENKINLSSDFRKNVEGILALQNNLKIKERKINYDGKEVEILAFYTEYKCLAIGVSKTLFERISKIIPLTIPLLVPHLVTEIDYEEIKKITSFID
ncbi:MAG: THUMP domain-containing protein [Candidatus Thorarchaeota archaeon]